MDSIKNINGKKDFKYIILYNIDDRRQTYNYYLIDNDDELLALYLNIDTPIKEFVSKEYKMDYGSFVDVDKLIESDIFLYNEYIKINYTHDDRMDEYMSEFISENFRGKYNKPYIDMDFNKEKVKSILRERKMELILS